MAQLLGRLSAFLASASILPWIVPCADSVAEPPAPQLSLSPPHNIFVQEEWVSMSCSVPEGQRASGFSFYEQNKRNGEWILLAKYQEEKTFVVSTTQLGLNKTFACSYLGTDSEGASSESALSNKVIFSIIEPPESPRLSLVPKHPIYIQGEGVTLTCLAPAGLNPTGYTFCEEKGGHVLPLQAKSSSHTFHLDGTSAGWFYFYCTYWIWVSGREIQSPRSNSIRVSWRESPLPPNLSLFPKHPIYIQGEGVALTCSAPAGLYLTGYMFYEERESQAHEVQPKNPSNTLRLDGKTAGRYSCVYWFRVSGREIQSPRSNSVPVVRTEPPQPPTLSLQPQHPIYIQGEEVALICSAPKGKAAAGYAFYQDKTHFSVERLRSHNNLCRLDGKAAGTFLCAYWIHVSGRLILSQSSISVSVTRTDLPAPVLKVDPPSGAVNEGEPLLISCLANRSNTEKRFHFYKDGVEMDSSNEGPLRDPSPNATLRIPQANSSHSGEFACSYEENMSGRWVSSPLSQMVNVTVHAPDSSLSAAVYACFALLLLIPVVSLACYYYCWRRKRASKGQEEFQPQQNQEETGNFGRLESQATALQLQVEARLKRLKPVEKDEVSYSEIQFRAPCGLNRLKPVKEDGALYSKIQFRPPHGLKQIETSGRGRGDLQ